MTEFVIPVPPTIAIPVRDGGLFPVRRVFCVGRNYAEHTREMGGDPAREPPFFFTKPADTLLPEGATLPYPPATADLHYEVELVVAIGTGGTAIPAGDALAHVWGYACGLDMTRRDLQAAAKREGRPWDMAKGFDHSAPIGMLAAAAEIGHPTAGAISLRVGDAMRQRGDLADMIWSVPEIVAALSGLVTLRPGDLIFTGTPSGVGPVSRGDRLLGTIDGVGEVRTTIGA